MGELGTRLPLLHTSSGWADYTHRHCMYRFAGRSRDLRATEGCIDCNNRPVSECVRQHLSLSPSTSVRRAPDVNNLYDLSVVRNYLAMRLQDPQWKCSRWNNQRQREPCQLDAPP